MREGIEKERQMNSLDFIIGKIEMINNKSYYFDSLKISYK